METQLALFGLIGFSDHDGTGAESDVNIDACRQQATDELTGWLVPLYTAADLATSTVINRWAAVLACVFLTELRGNPVPDSLWVANERNIGALGEQPGGLLKATLNEVFRIPGITRTDQEVPTFSNMTKDRRFRRESLRVIPSISSPIRSKLEQDVVHEIVLDR